MTLPDEYMRYPQRHFGQDHARYDWRIATNRPRADLPNKKQVAALIVVPLEFHRLNPEGKPFKHPGAMQTPYPDLRHFTTRDYGLRVGAYRILRELKQARLKAIFPINATLIERVRPLLDEIREDGHEIAAYGWDADAIHWGGISPAVEEKLVTDTRAAWTRAGISPRTWMSPARSQSFRTLELVRGHGFDICLDWEVDNVPVAFRTEHGTVTALPLFNELDDRKLLIDNRQTEMEWRDQIIEAVDFLKTEHDRYGPQIVSFTLTPYVIGQPFRIWALREVLAMIKSDSAVQTMTASELAEAWPK